MSDLVSLPVRFFTERKYKPNHLRVIVSLVRWQGEGRPSSADIARETGIDRRDVFKALADLRAFGEIDEARNVLFLASGQNSHSGEKAQMGEISPPASPLGSPPKDPGPQNTPPYIPPTNLDGRKALESDFAEFWKAYPRKVKRPHALKAYLGARKKADAATILEGLERYKRTKPEYADWAHPTSWLNAERWADEADAPSSQGPPSSDSERSLWALRLFDFRSRRFWSSMWGPPPGEAGCRVPRDLLEEMAAA